MKLKKTLSDVIPDYLTEGGIFKALTMMDVPWRPDISGEVLDIEYMGNISGSKRISPLINKMLGDNTELTAENVATIANVIYKLNIANWNKLYATLSLEYNPISNYDMTETETASGTKSGTRLNTGTQTVNETGTQETAHTGTQTTESTGTQATAHTGTQTTESTGTAENEHTGTQGTTSTSSAQGSGEGSTENNIFGFNSSTSVGDSDSATTTSTTNSATGSETRTDNLTDTLTNNLTDERTDNLTDTLTNNLTDERTDNLTDTRTDNLTNQRTDNLSETTSGTDSSSRTLTRTGNIGVTTSQQMIQSERDLWLWNFFYSVVFKDVDRVTTIATY